MKKWTLEDNAKLKLAIDRYVEDLKLRVILDYVKEELWNSYRNHASSDEMQKFIDSMKVTDEDVAQ